MRVLVWAQHLLGTGHTVRAAAIARALVAEGADVTLALGAKAPTTVDLRGVDILPLHPVAATDGSFTTIVDAAGTPYAALAEPRRDVLLAHVAQKGVDALVTETFPFGRRPFGAELMPVIAAARAGGARIFSSIRDVLVRKPAAKERAMAELARAHYDKVLVHADPRFVALGDSFAPAGSLADLIAYTGYVDAGAPVTKTGARQGIVVSAGGSGVGAALVEAAVAAAAHLDGGLEWRILVPPALMPSIDGWQRAAGPNVRLEENRPDFRALLAGAALSVSQAGYNTVLDVMEAGPRMVFVPFAAHEETEQTDRAAALARRGLATVVAERDLTADRLAEAVRGALAAPLPRAPELDRDGARHSAALVMARS